MLMGAPAHLTTQLFLITLAVIKGNKLCSDECFLGGVTVVFLSALACMAHSDGRHTLISTPTGENFSPLVLRGMVYSWCHMSVEVQDCSHVLIRVGPHVLFTLSSPCHTSM